jgi:signal transduction histidine kinase
MVGRMSDPQNSTTKLQQDVPAVKHSVLRILLEKISDGILWIDLEGTIKITSLALEKILHLPKGELVGRPFWDIFPDDFFGFSLREALRYGISYELLYKNNLEISTLFLYAGEKHEQGLLLKVCDITDREIFRSREAQGDRMKQLGEIAARLAHEIRNPLGGIRGFAMLLHRDLADKPHLQELAAQVLDGTRSLERLVSSMLEYARNTPLVLQTQDITAFLRNVARFVKMDPAFPPHVRLNLHIPPKPLLVPFDADALTRAILNLVTNGLQAMEQVGELTISLLHNGHTCQITITDTGVGMNEEEVSSLFTPFFTTKSKGNGLGLVETKKILTTHGGSIEVHSSPKKGSSFILIIPMRRQ